MPEQPTPEPTAEERFREAMQRILTVSKPELLRREAEEKARRKAELKKDDGE